MIPLEWMPPLMFGSLIVIMLIGYPVAFSLSALGLIFGFVSIYHGFFGFSFLQAIPWTSELRNIPEIARAHHEKLNGRGYPYQLSAPEIPVQSRMMTISDIFDALAAADRPYKKAVSVERALEILDLSVTDGELDADLVTIFKEARIYRRWKVEPLAY